MNNLTYAIKDLDTNQIYVENGEELKFVGKSALIDYIKTHDEFRERYFEMLNKHITGKATVSLLDKEALDEIMEEEAVVEGKKRKKDNKENAV